MNHTLIPINYHFAGMDDYFPELSDTGIKYFDIINDGDDETVYSQLNASLMK